MQSPKDLFSVLSKRYHGATPEALQAVMCPLLIKFAPLDRTVEKFTSPDAPGGFWRAKFKVDINDMNRTVMSIGRTGKFVPGTHEATGEWRELAKGRIIAIDSANQVAIGEIYTGDGKKATLEEALAKLEDEDLWEVDQYGASSKILSALAEHFLVIHGLERGYDVTRMPEDMARHLGSYANYDFRFSKNGRSLGVEAKSIWGTNTSCARLIHSANTAPKGDSKLWTEEQKRNYYPTSSCKFDTQDIFAVNLFLRTGNIRDFAFARSISKARDPLHGLPFVPKYPDHVTQNPKCEVDGFVWFNNIDDVWKLF